jgi:hypothetical protein
MDENVITRTRVRSDFLVARPSLASGFARLFDLFGAFDVYNVSADGAAADARALRADWAVIGQDLEDAIARFRAAHPELAARR